MTNRCSRQFNERKSKTPRATSVRSRCRRHIQRAELAEQNWVSGLPIASLNSVAAPEFDVVVGSVVVFAIGA